MKSAESGVENFAGFPWRISYRTSSLKPDGSAIDILHDFYIPVLQRARSYFRVAGFFRSTSLAAAAQGFSAFVGREGKAQFIVGADLELEDVKAILQGEEVRLTEQLNANLENVSRWPENVSNGVQLLGWMIANGHLEMRVAFRVHSQTREPIPFDSVEDGYVHMKWALFNDAVGNKIYISGSLNESRSALVLNAENIDVHCAWRGETERMRVEEAEWEFQELWEDRNPAFRILAIPDAVRQRLISLAEGVSRPLEIDGTSVAPLKVPPPSPLELLRFALIKDGPMLPGGKYVGMETAPIVPWPHQAIVARRIISSWPASGLLCDEVGLGKTIEAGLAIRSLFLSGLARRVLVCAPASLTQQWQRELAAKFYLPFGRALGGRAVRHEYLLPVEIETAADRLYSPGLTIISGGLITREDRQDDLAAALPFDLALVDEAHYARRTNPTQGTRAHPRFGKFYQTIRDRVRTKSRCLLLATATPMQLDPVEVSDLLALTRRVGSFQFDPSLMSIFYEILGNAVTGAAVSQQEWEFLRKAILSLAEQDPEQWRFVQGSVIDGRIRIAVRQWLEFGQVPQGPDRQRMLRVIFSGSPLSRAMLRHTRKLLEIYREHGRLEGMLAKRELLPLRGSRFTEQEQEAYDQLEIYCKELARQLAGRGNTRGRSAIGFYLSFLRLRFASSLYAIRETVRRRIERVEATLEAQDRTSLDELQDVSVLEEIAEEGDDDSEVVKTLLKDRTPEDLIWERSHLKGMLRSLEDLSRQSSKMTELLTILEHRRISGPERFRQTVVFTRFFDTLTDIVSRLRRASPRMLIGTYSGQGGQYLNPANLSLVGTDRDVVKHKFLRGEIDVLVCTDAAAEGLNLQTADFLVNFDLPWNPMKVEQRIGRIDRIGQKNETIYVSNLCYVGSAEEVVYGRLWQRLTLAGAVVGTQQISLLPVTPDEFLRLAEDPSFADKLEKLARERAFLFQKRTAAREIPPEEMYEIYSRMEQESSQRQVPVGLAEIWEVLTESQYLQDLGCMVILDPEQEVLKLTNVSGLPPKTALTTSRETFEAGIKDLEECLHFATYGDPIFDDLLAHLSQFDLPTSVKRLAVQVPELPAEMVGYAVATIDHEGRNQCRLVTSWGDLKGLEIDEARILTDNDVAPALESLRQMAYEEFRPHLAIHQIEDENERAGRSQLVLDYLVIRGLIRERQMLGKAAPLFWREIDAIEEEYHDRENLRIRKIPVSLAARLSTPLFPLAIPQMGDEAYVDAPQPLLKAAIESICRVADTMKTRRSELTTDDVLARVDRLLEQTRL